MKKPSLKSLSSERCPSCGGLDITGEQVEVSPYKATQNCHCSECDAEWEDVYSISERNVFSAGRKKC